MKRKSGGKRYFNSQGRSDRSRGMHPATAVTWMKWPEWAVHAYRKGYHDQANLSGEFAKFRRPFNQGASATKP